MDLTDRSAIVTGASRGLGRVIAERLLEAGASVLLVARGEVPLKRARDELTPLVTRGAQVLEALSADVSKREDCTAVVDYALATLPALTVLVNNAGVCGPIGPLEEVEWEAWEEAIRINLFGTTLMCRAVIPILRQRGYGKIINLSGGGATSPRPRFSAYAASKAAIVRLTETMAHELEDTHVDVNAIAPGPLNTRLLDQLLAAGPGRAGAAAYARALKQRDDGGVPLDKGAALAVFLASAESDGITGRLLSAVWDDWERLPARRRELARSDIFTLRRITPEDRGVSL